MKRLCIIPARGGSKRLPGKNIKKLNGKPLIFHTIDTALGLFDKIIVTSDSENILSVVENEYGNYSSENNTILEISKRSDELATDTSKVIDTVSHYFDKNEGYDQIWLMLPTCPLRNRVHVREAQLCLDKEEYEGIVSITEYPFPPSLGLLEGDRGNLVRYHYSDPWRTGNSRSQDHPVVSRPNGAIYGMKSKSFDEHRNFYKGFVRGYYMSNEDSIDIDNEFEFKMADLLLKEKKK